MFISRFQDFKILLSTVTPIGASVKKKYESLRVLSFDQNPNQGTSHKHENNYKQNILRKIA